MTKKGSTLCFSKRKESLYNFSTTGNEMQAWLEKVLGFSGKSESAGFLRIMLKFGYLVSTQFSHDFNPDNFYTIQAPTLWPNESWKPIEDDYICYLFRRANVSTAAASSTLAPYEEERLEYFIREYEETGKCEILMERAVKQDELLSSLGSKGVQFSIQEWGFWNFYCPKIQRVDLTFASISNRRDDLVQNRNFLKKATKHQILAHWLSMITQYKMSLRNDQFTIGEASSKLVDYCDLIQGMDSFVNYEGTENVWYKKEAWRSVQQPTVAQVRIWVNDFKLLLQDPHGFAIFYDFDKCLLKSYGEFKRKSSRLTETSPLKLKTTAFELYQEFIKLGSPNQIGVPLDLRVKLDIIFCTSQDISYDCFDKINAYITESSNETLNLWRRMQDLKKLLDDTEFQREAHSIYEIVKFISQRKIHLPANINSVIHETFERKERVPVDCFDKVQEYLFESMRESYDMFCKSKYLSDLFINIKENRDFRMGKFDSPISLIRPTFHRPGPVQTFPAPIAVLNTDNAPKSKRKSLILKVGGFKEQDLIFKRY